MNWAAATTTSLVGNTRYLFVPSTFFNGLLPQEDQVTCAVNKIPIRCYQFGAPLNWIYGNFAVDQLLSLLPAMFFYVNNLLWPGYQNAAVSPAVRDNVIYIGTPITTTNIPYSSLLAYSNLGTGLANNLVSATLNVDKKWRQDVDVTYTFTFVANDHILAGSTVTLTLPTQYNLIASYPPIQISYPEFTNASSTQILSSLYTANVVTIYNVGFLFKLTPFKIIIQGMRNPNVASAMTGFSITITYSNNNYMINSLSNFVTVTLQNLTDVYTPYLLTVTKINVFPINIGVLADYTFTIIPTTKLSPGAEIHIRFPPEYSTLPQNPNCNIYGGVDTFSSCYLLVNEIIIQLNQYYNTGPIYITITSILNPNYATTSAFYLYTFYDGSIVDQTASTSTVLSSLQVSLVPKASLLSMRQFYYDPVNEGETALYTMSFLPTANIPSGMNIYIRFPSSFDLRLGKNVIITITNGLSGNVQTNLTNRVITIWGFNNYSVALGQPITVIVNGVVNPNKPSVGNNGYISVGVIWPGSNIFLNYLEKAGTILTTSAPEWLTLNYLVPSNAYSRTYADYTINITATNMIPRTDYSGKIIVDFPWDYEKYTGNLQCASNTTNIGAAISCQQNVEMATVTGQPNDISGDIAFTIQGVQNPLNQIVTQSFFVRTYNGLTRTIIERSFQNLDPINLNFSYPGPLIVVNNDQPIYCELGTQTTDLYIVMSEISALNLTFVPATPGFTFVPNEIKIYVGQIQVKFRVSVPLGFTPGTYYVEWVTLNDLTPPIYTPIKKTTVIITGKGSRLLASKHSRHPDLHQQAQ